MIVQAFRRKARDLWVKYINSFPCVSTFTLLDAYENYFQKKMKEGNLMATIYLEYANELRGRINRKQFVRFKE